MLDREMNGAGGRDLGGTRWTQTHAYNSRELSEACRAPPTTAADGALGQASRGFIFARCCRSRSARSSCASLSSRFHCRRALFARATRLVMTEQVTSHSASSLFVIPESPCGDPSRSILRKSSR